MRARGSLVAAVTATAAVGAGQVGNLTGPWPEGRPGAVEYHINPTAEWCSGVSVSDVLPADSPVYRCLTFRPRLKRTVDAIVAEFRRALSLREGEWVRGLQIQTGATRSGGVFVLASATRDDGSPLEVVFIAPQSVGGATPCGGCPGCRAKGFSGSTRAPSKVRGSRRRVGA